MAALGIKLISLAGARRAVRRWFRRGLPPGDSSDEEDDGLAVPPAPPNTPADLSLIDEEDEDDDNNKPDQQAVEEDSEHYLDDSEYDQDFYNDSSTMSLNMFVPTVSSMQQAVAPKPQGSEEPQQRSDAKVEENEQPQQLTDSKTQENEQQPQQQLADAKAKEIEQPQQLADSKIDALTEQMSQLNVARTDEPVVAVAKPLSTPGDDDATITEPIDPAVLAERAVHLKFIGEALDMVSTLSFSLLSPSSIFHLPSSISHLPSPRLSPPISRLPSLSSHLSSQAPRRGNILLTSGRLLDSRPNSLSSPTRLPSAA